MRLRERDLTVFAQTLCVRPNKHSEIQLRVLPSMIYTRTYRVNLWWDIMSNAFEKSRMPMSILSVWPNLDSRLCDVINCDSRLNFVQNPCWYGDGIIIPVVLVAAAENVF